MYKQSWIHNKIFNSSLLKTTDNHITVQYSYSTLPAHRPCVRFIVVIIDISRACTGTPARCRPGARPARLATRACARAIVRL